MGQLRVLPSVCSRWILILAHGGEAFETIDQPQMPAAGAVWRGDSHNDQIWDGMIWTLSSVVVEKEVRG